jgi:hypothetical protein
MLGIAAQRQAAAIWQDARNKVDNKQQHWDWMAGSPVRADSMSKTSLSRSNTHLRVAHVPSPCNPLAVWDARHLLVEVGRHDSMSARHKTPIPAHPQHHERRDLRLPSTPYMNKIFSGQKPALSGTFDHAQKHLLRSIYADELEQFDTKAISNEALKCLSTAWANDPGPQG